MITYEKRVAAFNLLFRVYGSAWPRSLILALPSAIITLILHYCAYDFLHDNVLHPLPLSIFTTAVGFIILFRTNLSFSRYWEGRTMVANMSSKWGDAALQVVCFDESTEKEPAASLGLQFRAEFVHLMSLMHALAMQDARGDEDLNNLVAGSMIDVPEAPPSDAADVPEWNKSRGLRSMIALRVHARHFRKYFRHQPLVVLGGLGVAERQQLQPSEARVFTVLCWVHRALVARRGVGGLAQEPPIIGRIYQMLSDGTLGYENAVKICNTPFPFPYAQAVTLLLYIYSLIVVPLFMASFLRSPWLAALLSSCGVLAYYMLNEVAREIEEPFKFDPNDLPVRLLHHRFNEHLVTAFWRSGPAPPMDHIRAADLLSWAGTGVAGNNRAPNSPRLSAVSPRGLTMHCASLGLPVTQSMSVSLVVPD